MTRAKPKPKAKVVTKARPPKLSKTEIRTKQASTVFDTPPDPNRFTGTREEQVAAAYAANPSLAKPLPPLHKTATALQKELISRTLARRRLLPFVQRMNERYDAGWVHEDICRRLEKFSDDVAAGLSPRLMILMPPRHGKSELASRMFPPWHLGRHPEHEFIACSYNLSLAMGFSRKVKQVIDDPAYQGVFPTKLDPNNQSTEEWGIAGERGGYVAAGIGGPITGKGAHVLVIDDPVKNAEEADSADGREKVWEWYLSTAYTRLAPGGGVLIIQCMVGDTPVLLANGAECRLDTLRAGDKVATYSRGLLATSDVKAVKSNGHDSVFKITTSSGKIVRANGRHPFLAAVDGELKWVRTRSLTTTHKIVALPGSGGNGEALPVLPRGVESPSAAEGSVRRTTTSRSGLTGTAPRASILSRVETPTSSTATASLSPSTTNSWQNKEACAACAGSPQATISPTTGRTSSPSITATTPARSEDCCATTATQESDTLELSPWHLPLPGISDFTLDDIVSVEPGGVEEVFDVQIERTENFIANGLVSHNTWWHDDDLSGRIQQMMVSGADDEDIDQFEVMKYPALATADEYLDEDTGELVTAEPEDPSWLAKVMRRLRLLRHKGDALHPARYDGKKLNKIRALNRKDDGTDGRWWSALYQQNPVPDDGGYFTKSQFKRAQVPHISRCNVFIAWDFAISEKKQNDYTVGSVGLQDEDDMLHVAEIVRFKSADSFFIVESILNLSARWPSASQVIGFEDGQIWRAIEALLKKRMRERRMYPAIVVLPPITDKLARARPLQGRMQQGMVSFSSSGEWYEEVRNEMLRFPAGVHDDQVDSLAWMTKMAMERAAPRKKVHPGLRSWRDKLKLAAGAVSHMGA